MIDGFSVVDPNYGWRVTKTSIEEAVLWL